MTRHTLLLACLLTTACSAPAVMTASTPDPSLSVTAVELFRSPSSSTRLGALDWRGGIEIEHLDERFGGLSAIDVSSNGNRLLAVSDSAWWVTSQLRWSDNGELDGVSDLVIESMRDESGAHLEDERGDSEGLAALGNGRWAVSFEREHRIWAYDLGADWSGTASALPEPISRPQPAGAIANNGGMEALTLLDDGQLLVGIEDPIDPEPDYDLWQMNEHGGWHRTGLAGVPEFGLTGMATLDHEVYALERAYSPDVGNRIRIIRFAEAELAMGRVIEPEVLGELGPDTIADNFEGITAFRRGGETILLIVSDDNYNPRQRTLLLAFAVAD
tara:strand:+ start:5953 stop:6942 length:990 start_codon:yes stop_codon:yes gene_type:complete